MNFTIPPPESCVSAFRGLRGKLKAPFRVTLKGKVADLQPTDSTQNGNAKRLFNIVDGNGVFIACCAMQHNTEAVGLKDDADVMIYFGTGRGPIGSMKGMLYIMRDSMLLPIPGSSTMSVNKTEELLIE